MTLFSWITRSRKHANTVRGSGAFSTQDLATLYEEHFEFVFRNACRLGVAQAHAEDIVQETFLVVHRKLQEGPELSSIKAWLFVLLRGVVANHLRARQRERRSDESLDTQCNMPSPEQHMESRQRLTQAQRLLDTMSVEQREVFLLFEIEQLTAPEIAEACAIPLNTVYSRLRVARAHMNAFTEQEKVDVAAQIEGAQI